MAQKSYDFLYKLLFIGDSGSFKTQIIWLLSPEEHGEFISTIGIDLKIRNDVIDGKKIKSQMWDTSGQERFHTITTSYFRGARGIFLVFNVASRKAFDNLNKWLDTTRSYAPDNVSVMILANKCEEGERQVSPEEVANFALGNDIPYMEVSSLDRANITEAFDKLLRAVHEQNMMAQERMEQERMAQEMIDRKPDENNTTEKTRCNLS